MKRHTHDYEMFYSREAVRSFDELVRLGDSTRSKELARDYTVVERKLHRADEGDDWDALRSRQRDRNGLSNETVTIDEPRAAFTICNAAEQVDPDQSVLVLADPAR